MNYVGIDGCQGGWIAFCITENNDFCIKKFETEKIKDIIKNFQPAFFLVDIPLGLPDSFKKDRKCDIEARNLLGFPRSASIFNPPLWEILEIENYKEANLKYKSIIGKGLTKQSFLIIDKIRVVNYLIRDNKKYRNTLKEFHPEIAFYFLNGEKRLLYSKRSKEGKLERVRILCEYIGEIDKEIEKMLQKEKTRKDDIIDACCGAVVAKLANGNYKKIPKEPEKDRYGINMEINYY